MDGPKRRGWGLRALTIGLLGLLAFGGPATSGIGRSVQAADVAPESRDLGRPGDLPLPGRLSVPAYEAKLFPFLEGRRYEELGWLRDKRVRDTGPYIDGKYYGTHPAVRVIYSPGVIRWLMDGRVGAIPDGEMIIKEQYPAPAARHEGKTEAELRQSLESWTVMVKDSSGSRDGWFWSNPARGQKVVDNHRYPFEAPISGFGQYCVRCHASTHTPGEAATSPANEFTFASLRNIAGFPGEPLLFRVDDSWRREERKAEAAATPPRPDRAADPAFLRFFDSIKPTGLPDVAHLPPSTHDWDVVGRDGSHEFATSNQCMSCHAGLVAPYGPSMFVPIGKDAEFGGPGRDVSPHGEWRWTPMGLAGRDPIFHAQVESEVRTIRKEFGHDPKLADELAATLSDACLRCHGAMGKKQFEADHPGSSAKFSLDLAHAVEGPGEHPGQGTSRYGALARDGVGCMVCHRMQPRPQAADDGRSPLQFFLETSTTGNFHLGPKGEIYGPYRDDDIAPYAMEHATGLKPKQGAFLRSSRMCGTCHTVALPNLDRPLGDGHSDWKPDELTRAEVVPAFRKFHHHVEQATYLEWLNSEYENEVNPANPRARSCQDCHMPRGLKDDRHGLDVPQIRTRIAAIQDATYPEAENLAPHDQLKVRFREDGYRRHNFAGLNAFLLTLFDQFDDVLGVRRVDFMTGSPRGPADAIADMARTARDDVASLDVEAGWQSPNRVTARVLVRNKVGHRFPSGVGFRRAFLELAVVQPADDRTGSAERVVWASGRTNALGVILGGDGQPLPSEAFTPDPADGHQRYQDHHEVITSPDQVQVYESLLKDAKGRFTTSFVHGCETVKDNRLLPRGWKPDGPAPGALTGRYLRATHPSPDVADDPRYVDGSGSDEVTYRVDLPPGVDPARLRVRATLHYQAIPPYFLRNLFETAPDGPATRRLHHMTSRVDLSGTPIEGWKLPVASASCDVGPRPLNDPRLHRAEEGANPD